MGRNSIKHLLMSSNYFVLNKKLVKILGIETAFFLTSLAEADEMLADKDGWFYQTVPQMQEVTGLSEHKQNSCIEKLVSLGLLEKENKGMPMKRYFRLNYIQVLKILVPSTEKITDQAPEKFGSMDRKNSGACTEKITDNKEYNINNINKDDDVPLDEESINRAKNLSELRKIAVTSTGLSPIQVDGVIKPYIYKDIDLTILLEKIKQSDFLLGKCSNKPTIAHFTQLNMLNKILADYYKNKVTPTEQPASKDPSRKRLW